ncbi:MAG: carbon-nitrogen hydrolase family protein [Betaproteobacteria bacterium]
MNPGPFRAAAVQMVSDGDVEANLAEADRLVAAAVADGAELVLLPEYFGILGAHATDKVRAAERDGDGPQQAFLARAARDHGIVLIGGSVPIASDDPARVRSACLAYGPDGARLARYDKIHLFRYAYGDEAYDETRTIERGDAPVAFDAPFGRVGLAICYDLRFPELFRATGDCALVCVPSAFTWTTGHAHWHLLLRARAVENQAYVLAAAQGGMHANGRRTYGHSCLVDPWGEVIAERIDDGPGCVAGTCDPARTAEVRTRLPAHSHRVL